jgi:drug/metabolite transporter (DMT)-like permease
MVGAAFFFSVMTLFVKLAGARLPSMQIVLARYVVMLVATQAMLWHARLPAGGTDRPALVGRAVTGFAALSLFYYAVTQLPLGDVTTLQYTSPVWTAIIAAYFLREHTGRIVWAGAALSMVGVLLVARPSFLFGGEGLPAVPVVAVLCGAFLSASAYTFIRKLRATDPPLVVIYWFCVIGVVLSLPLALPVWTAPTPVEWAYLLGVGVSTQIAQLFLTNGLQLEAAGRATSVGYLQIAFAFGWGLLFFGDRLDGWGLLGVGVIVLGVLLVARKG